MYRFTCAYLTFVISTTLIANFFIYWTISFVMPHCVRQEIQLLNFIRERIIYANK